MLLVAIVFLILFFFVGDLRECYVACWPLFGALEKARVRQPMLILFF